LQSVREPKRNFSLLRIDFLHLTHFIFNSLCTLPNRLREQAGQVLGPQSSDFAPICRRSFPPTTQKRIAQFPAIGDFLLRLLQKNHASPAAKYTK